MVGARHTRSRPPFELMPPPKEVLTATTTIMIDVGDPTLGKIKWSGPKEITRQKNDANSTSPSCDRQDQ